MASRVSGYGGSPTQARPGSPKASGSASQRYPASPMDAQFSSKSGRPTTDRPSRSGEPRRREEGRSSRRSEERSSRRAGDGRYLSPGGGGQSRGDRKGSSSRNKVLMEPRPSAFGEAAESSPSGEDGFREDPQNLNKEASAPGPQGVAATLLSRDRHGHDGHQDGHHGHQKMSASQASSMSAPGRAPSADVHPDAWPGPLTLRDIDVKERIAALEQVNDLLRKEVQMGKRKAQEAQEEVQRLSANRDQEILHMEAGIDEIWRTLDHVLLEKSRQADRLADLRKQVAQLEAEEHFFLEETRETKLHRQASLASEWSLLEGHDFASRRSSRDGGQDPRQDSKRAGSKVSNGLWATPPASRAGSKDVLHGLRF